LATKAALAASLLLGGSAAADLLPPERASVLPGGFIVADEQDARLDLRDLAAGAPALLLPVFTRCSGTCPLTALFLKKTLGEANAPFRVIVLSFDPEDAAKDLREFRERFTLPPEWRLVRSDDAAAVRGLLDGLDFHFMKTSGGFDHPDQTFVLSAKGEWAATLQGADPSRSELETAFRRALAAGHPAPLSRLRAWLIRPATWILCASAGLLASLVTIVLARSAKRLSP